MPYRRDASSTQRKPSQPNPKDLTRPASVVAPGGQAHPSSRHPLLAGRDAYAAVRDVLEGPAGALRPEDVAYQAVRFFEPEHLTPLPTERLCRLAERTADFVEDLLEHGYPPLHVALVLELAARRTRGYG